jgi:hypothetical protein
MDPTKKQLPSRNEVSLALDRWTSKSKLAMMLVIAYCTNRSQPLWEVQLAFGEIDCLRFSTFES